MRKLLVGIIALITLALVVAPVHAQDTSCVTGNEYPMSVTGTLFSGGNVVVNGNIEFREGDAQGNAKTKPLTIIGLSKIVQTDANGAINVVVCVPTGATKLVPVLNSFTSLSAIDLTSYVPAAINAEQASNSDTLDGKDSTDFLERSVYDSTGIKNIIDVAETADMLAGKPASEYVTVDQLLYGSIPSGNANQLLGMVWSDLFLDQDGDTIVETAKTADDSAKLGGWSWTDFFTPAVPGTAKANDAELVDGFDWLNFFVFGTSGDPTTAKANDADLLDGFDSADFVQTNDLGTVNVGNANTLDTLDSTDFFIKQNHDTDADGVLDLANQATAADYATSAGDSGTLDTLDSTDFVQFDTNDNVGIGTTTPVTTLDVAGASGKGLWVRETQSTSNLGASAGRGVTLGYSGLANAGILQAHDYDTADNDDDGTAESGPDVLSINPLGGNVGIGTTSPTTALDVSGTITADTLILDNTPHIDPTKSVADGYILVYDSGALKWDDAADFDNCDVTDGSCANYVLYKSQLTDPDSTIGIGTADPVTTLDVKGDSAGKGIWVHETDSIQINDANAGQGITLGYSSTSDIGVLQSYDYTDYDYTPDDGDDTNEDFGAAQHLSINPLGGNVGIGTTNPNVLLEIAGGTTGRVQITDGGGATRKTLILEQLGYAGHNYARIESYDYGASSGGKLVINAQGGNVGIGTTTPVTTLDVAGASGKGLWVRETQSTSNLGASAGRGVTLGYSGLANAGILQAHDYDTADNDDDGTAESGPDVLSINPLGGNVGVGTTSPSSKLDVAGMITTSKLKVSATNLKGDKTTIIAGDVLVAIGDTGELEWSDAAAFDNCDVSDGSCTNYVLYHSQLTDTDSTIGIGTTTPVTTLDVKGDSAGKGLWVRETDSIQINDANAGQGITLGYSSTSDIGVLQSYDYTDYDYTPDDGDDTNEDFGAAQHLSINPLGGNVGVGTTSPATKLHIKDTTDTVFHNLLTLEESDSDKGDGESVGLTFSLVDDNNNAAAGYSASIKAVTVDGSSAAGEKRADLQFTVVDDSTETQAMTIKYDGTVLVPYGALGIGTTNPATTLDVKGDTNNGIWVRGSSGLISGLSGAGKGLVLKYNTRGDVDAGVIQASDAGTTSGGTVLSKNLLLNPNGGNVGVGTGTNALSAKLDVAGEIHSTGLDVDGTIYSTGLDVDGTIQIDGSLQSSGTILTINDDLDVAGGDITSFNTATSDTSATQPHIVLDSTNQGGIWTNQGAYISMGEGAYNNGNAAMHMTYRGDGYGFIGTGVISNGVPGYSYLRFSAINSNIYTPDALEVGSLTVGGGTSAAGGLTVGSGTSVAKMTHGSESGKTITCSASGKHNLWQISVGTQWATTSTRVFVNVHEKVHGHTSGFGSLRIDWVEAFVKNDGYLNVQAMCRRAAQGPYQVYIDYLLIR